MADDFTQESSLSEKTFADIVIVGGGFTGASLALMIAQSKLTVNKIIVIDALPLQVDQPLQPSFDARSTALSYSSVPLLHQMGVWQDLLPHLEAIEKVIVTRQQGCHRVVMNCQDHQQPALGYVGENQQLGQVLMKAVADTSLIDWWGGRTVRHLQAVEGGYELEVKDAATTTNHFIHTSMLVMAGGAQNPLVKKLGIGYEEEPYQQQALITNVQLDRPHRQMAHERFTQQGPLALLPLSGHRCAVVWTRQDDEMPALLEASDSEFLNLLQKHVGWRLGRFTRVGQRDVYPLSKVMATEQVRSHLAIVGNAAHSLHPVAGQGFNLILRDLAVLVDVWIKGQQEGKALGDLPTLLNYHQRQSLDQSLTVGLSDRLPKWFTHTSFPFSMALELGMLGLSLPNISKTFARYAMGLGVPSVNLSKGSL